MHGGRRKKMQSLVSDRRDLSHRQVPGEHHGGMFSRQWGVELELGKEVGLRKVAHRSQ